MMFVLSLIVSVLIGFVACHVFFKGTKKMQLHFLFNLAVPVGVGISSAIFIFLSLLKIPALLVLGAEIAILIYLFYKYSKMDAAHPFKIKHQLEHFNFATALTHPILLLATVLYILSWLLDVGVFYFNSVQNSHGLWDAWSCWNLIAKFIARAPSDWPSLLHQMNAIDFHPDYPLLQRGFIANNWILLGNETVWVPIVSAFIFTFCAIGLITSTVSIYNSKTEGFIAGLVLLCTPFYMVMGYSQYADNTVGYFYLATIVLLTIARSGSVLKPNMFIAAGVAAGLAAYSKNEGLLFILFLFMAQLSRVFLKNKGELWKELKYLFYGMLPFLLLVAYQKLIIAPPNQIVSAQGTSTFTKLTDPERYKIVIDWFSTQFTGFGKWEFHPWWFFLLGALYKGINMKRSNYSFFSNIVLLLLMVVGFFFVEIITPLGLVYFLSASVHRLFFQLFPTFIFVYFMAIGGQQAGGVVGWIEAKFNSKRSSKTGL